MGETVSVINTNPGANSTFACSLKECDTSFEKPTGFPELLSIFERQARLLPFFRRFADDMPLVITARLFDTSFPFLVLPNKLPSMLLAQFLYLMFSKVIIAFRPIPMLFDWNETHNVTCKVHFAVDLCLLVADNSSRIANSFIRARRGIGNTNNLSQLVFEILVEDLRMLIEDGQIWHRGRVARGESRTESHIPENKI